MKTRSAFSLFLSLLVLAMLVPPAAAGQARTELVSRYQGVGMIEGNSSTFGGHVISGSGRFVVFTVDDNDLPGADGTIDVYVRDRRRDRTRLVSQSSSEEAVESNASDQAAISDNGRYVAFSTSANNMPGADGTEDVLVRDLRTGKTRLVSKTSTGTPANGNSESPSLSANGRYVAFDSNAPNLPGEDGYRSVYVHDRDRGRTRLASRTSAGAPADGGDSHNPSLSADGLRVAFFSGATNLPGSMGEDVYVWDAEERKLRLASQTSDEEVLTADAISSSGALSANGRFVVFESAADNLPGGTGAYDQVFVRDLRARRTRLASKSSSGDAGDAFSGEAAISGSGRYVVFETDATNLGGGPDPVNNVYIHDRGTGTTRLLSRSTQGEPGDDDIFYPSVSADARFVAFSGRANNFSSADDDDYSNAFVRGPLR
jgi:Tol biopolymer transport system component